jgi:hypothetical protein
MYHVFHIHAECYIYLCRKSTEKQLSRVWESKYIDLL